LPLNSTVRWLKFSVRQIEVMEVLGAVILGILSLFLGYGASKITLKILHQVPRFLRNIIAVCVGLSVAYFTFMIAFFFYYFGFLVAITPEDKVSLRVPGYRIEMLQARGSEPFTYTDLYLTIFREADGLSHSVLIQSASYAPRCRPMTERINSTVYFLCSNQTPSEEVPRLDMSNLTLHLITSLRTRISQPLASFDYKLNSSPYRILE
jgi:hypothetical protein